MPSRRARRPEPCGQENCGLRRFHVGDDGYTYCDQGHQQSERGTVIAEDTGELVKTGRSHRRRDSDAGSSARSRSRGFTGGHALEQYVLALQLVLRKQVKWLIEAGKLPVELEMVVRDLWALRLRKLQNRVPTTYDSETDTEGHSQVFSSQSEGESGADSQTTRGHWRKRQGKADATVNLNDTLVICYLGMLLLRIPFPVADLIHHINTGDVLYYQAAKGVPSALKELLPGEHQLHLEPQTLLQPLALHQKILETASLFDKDFGMELPAVNSPLLLYRWMRVLALPIEVFAATQRLARILEIEFVFKDGGKVGSNRLLRYPEVQLMAVMVVSTKLLFPPDDIDRYPVSSSDLSALQMDWSTWVQAQSESKRTADGDSRPGLSFDGAFKVSEADCLAMGDDELDRYLDWYQENVATENVREQGRAGNEADFRRTLLRMFPVQTPETGASSSTRTAHESQSLRSETDNTHGLKVVQQSLAPKRVVVSEEGNEVARPGSFYRRYRDVQDLDEPVKVLYERAAELGGVSLEGMVKAVFLVERKLQKYEEQLRRAVDSR